MDTFVLGIFTVISAFIALTFGRKKKVEEIKPVELVEPHIETEAEIYSNFIATVNVVREEIINAPYEQGFTRSFSEFCPILLSKIGREVTKKYMPLLKTADIDFSKLDELTIEELVRINRNLRWNWVELVEFAESTFPGVRKRVDVEDALNCLSDAELNGRLPEKQRKALLQGELLKYYELRAEAQAALAERYPPLSAQEKLALQQDDVERFKSVSKQR